MLDYEKLTNPKKATAGSNAGTWNFKIQDDRTRKKAESHKI